METLTPPPTVRTPGGAAWNAVVEGGATAEPIEAAWLRALGSYFFHGRCYGRAGRQPQVRIDDPAHFVGRLRAGRLGGLPYCHLEATPHVFADQGPMPPGMPRHLVVLQLSGVTRHTADGRTVRARPGDMLLLNDISRVCVVHETRVEQVVLLDPLAGAGTGRFGPPGLHSCVGPGGQGRMVFRWVAEACLDADFADRDACQEVASLLTRLLEQVLSSSGRADAAAVPSPALARERIEDYIGRHLKDPTLDPAAIAQAFGCSVRTLHRAFARAGKESLERYLWRRRVEASARALRDATAAPGTLSELAADHGFSSPTHFSTLFREILGLTPSAYRRLHQGGEGTPDDTPS